MECLSLPWVELVRSDLDIHMIVVDLANEKRGDCVMGNMITYADEVRSILKRVAEHLKKIPKPGVRGNTSAGETILRTLSC